LNSSAANPSGSRLGLALPIGNRARADVVSQRPLSFVQVSSANTARGLTDRWPCTLRVHRHASVARELEHITGNVGEMAVGGKKKSLSCWRLAKRGTCRRQ